MKSASTIKHIARELGISPSTVSRAINGKSVVSAETRRKVLETAKKYDYTPNEVARSLQKSSTKTVAVVLPDISERFFGTIVKQLEGIIAQEGYMTILADTHEKADKEHEYLDMLYKRRVDAVVVATVDMSGSTAERFIEDNIPVIFIDNLPAPDSIDAIAIDNRKASEIAVHHLMSNGHKRIAAIIGSLCETTGVQRLEGYRDAIDEYDEALVAYGDYKQQSGYDAMKKLLEGRDVSPFSAVYVTSEKMTYGALRAIRDSGLRVPEDISVVGFDIHNHDDDRSFNITTLRQPEAEIGERVGRLILQRLDKSNCTSKEKTLLEPYLEEGDSVKKIN